MNHKPKIVARRGASGYAPEITLGLGVDYVTSNYPDLLVKMISEP